MRKFRVLCAGALALALVLGASPGAEAASITGSVSFGGAFVPTGGSGLADATGVDIIGDIAVVSCAISASCQGSFAGVVGLVSATYSDFTFDPLGGSIAPLWSFTFAGITYSFDLGIGLDHRADRLCARTRGNGHSEGHRFRRHVRQVEFLGRYLGRCVRVLVDDHRAGASLDAPARTWSPRRQRCHAPSGSSEPVTSRFASPLTACPGAGRLFVSARPVAAGRGKTKVHLRVDFGIPGRG